MKVITLSNDNAKRLLDVLELANEFEKEEEFNISEDKIVIKTAIVKYIMEDYVKLMDRLEDIMKTDDLELLNETLQDIARVLKENYCLQVVKS